MKTQIVLEVDHPKPLPNGFSDMAAGRVETMACVELVVVLSEKQVEGMDSQMQALNELPGLKSWERTRLGLPAEATHNQDGSAR